MGSISSDLLENAQRLAEDQSPETTGTDADFLELRRKVLLDRVVEDLYDRGLNERVSRTEIGNRVSEILGNISPDEADRLDEEFDRLTTEIGRMETKSYRIGFPLNLDNWPVDGPMRIFETVITEVEQTTWKERYHQNTDLPDDEDDGVLEANYTYWEVEMEGCDPYYVVNRIKSDLQVLLGKLMYAIRPWSYGSDDGQYTRYVGRDTRRGPVQSGLRLPPVFLVRTDEDHVWNSGLTRPLPEEVPIFGSTADSLAIRYEGLPRLQRPTNDSDEDTTFSQRLARGFGNFFTASIEPDPRKAFLDYWRAVERPCDLSGSNTTDYDEIINHLNSVIDDFDQLGTLAESLNGLRERRNAYVHQFKDPVITNGSVQLLRVCFYEVVKFITEHDVDEGGLDHWLSHYNKDIDELQDSLSSKLKEVATASREARALLAISSKKDYSNSTDGESQSS